MNKDKPNYFKAISIECDKLTEEGQKYLDQFDFLTVDQMADRIWEAYLDKFQEVNEKWEDLPEWAQDCIDGVPYCAPPRNGSIHFLLGYSPTAQEACLRNLLEIAEGRTTEVIDLSYIVDKDFWKKYPHLREDIEKSEMEKPIMPQREKERREKLSKQGVIFYPTDYRKEEYGG